MTFEASYVGSPIIDQGVYLGAPVEVDPTQVLALSSFTGTGYLDFEVIEKLSNTTYTASASIAVTLASTNSTTSVQVVTATGSAGTTLSGSAAPGRVLRVASNPPTFSSGSGKSYLTILSYPFQVSAGVYGVLVQGQATGVVNGTASVTVEATSNSDPDYHVLSYVYRSGSGNALLSNLDTTKTYTNGATADGFLIVPVTKKDYQSVLVTTNTTGTLARVDTGIDVAIGDPGSSDPTVLVSTAVFSVPFIRGSTAVGETNPAANGFPNTAAAFLAGLSAVDILDQLRIAISTNTILNTLLEEVNLNNSQLPYNLTFNSTFIGQESNRIFYKMTAVTGDGSSPPTDLKFQGLSNLYATQIAMTGGQDAMGTGQLFLYDVNGNPLVLLQAVSPGSAGNKIRVTIRPIPPGQFRMEVVDEEGINFNVPIQPESFLLNNYSVDPTTGLYPETLDSKLVRAYFFPVVNSNGNAVSQLTYSQTPQRLAPPVQTLGDSAVDNIMHPSHKGIAYLANIFLSGGSEPANYKVTDPTEQDYVDAVKRLESTDCAIITIAGVSITDARYELSVSELVAQAERSNTLNGLRIAVLAAPPRVSEARANSINSGISSKRVVTVAGYSTMVGARYLGVNSIPPTGIYCGILSNIPPHISPAAVSVGQAASGVLSVDSKSDPNYLDALTRGGLEVLYFDGGMRLYKFLNGITTSSDPNEKYVSIRRMTDQIITDLARNLMWVRSSPNTRSLRSRVATACDAYLRSLQREESIYAWSPTICDESINSISDISSGKLNIRITFTPVYPADFIKVNVIRDLTAEFSISTAAGGA
jgi:hypothetical protein